jgi:hypothetical protein
MLNIADGDNSRYCNEIPSLETIWEGKLNISVEWQALLSHHFRIKCQVQIWARRNFSCVS